MGVNEVVPPTGQGQMFLLRLVQEIVGNLPNNFTSANYDSNRYGALSATSRAADAVSGLLSRLRLTRVDSHTLRQVVDELTPHLEGLGALYDKLADQTSKELLLKLFAYRALGYRKVMLPHSGPDFWRRLARLKSQCDERGAIKVPFQNRTLPKFDFEVAGYPVRLHASVPGALELFELRQYEFSGTGEPIVAKRGDVVIDCGACWGDTALYFAARVQPSGRVFAFEFIPSNIEVLRKNLELNPTLKRSITLVDRAVWSDSNVALHFTDNGPGSRVAPEPQPGYEGSVKTLTIDDLVEREALDSVDFIKMDIEGAETWALKGAEKTIRRFQPTLAISVYHRLEDFVEVPQLVNSFSPDYEYHLGHASIHNEETVLFAVPDRGAPS